MEPRAGDIEGVARASYARLLAILSAKTGNIAAAEDALSDAFAAALAKWPEDGPPDNPEGWLLTVARNRWRDRMKSAVTRTSAPLDEAQEAALEEVDPEMIPDNRLLMMFVAAHPAIDATIRTPLMLQTVLGLEAERIAAAFLIPGSALAQRLVRAKRKIKAAAIPFITPDRSDMPNRLEAVLEAIYGAYALDWMADEDLTSEAIYLADLTVEMLPEEPEALGLAALLNFSHARAAARAGAEFIPLQDQDPSTWDRRAIARAETLLRRAQQTGRIGRFQIEAAIQSAHCARKPGERPNWTAIAALYEALVKTAPTIGAAVGRAAAFGEAFGAKTGLRALGQIAATDAQGYQPYWATRAHLLRANGQDAGAAFAKAIALCTHPPTRVWLEKQTAD